MNDLTIITDEIGIEGLKYTVIKEKSKWQKKKKNMNTVVKCKWNSS